MLADAAITHERPIRQARWVCIRFPDGCRRDLNEGGEYPRGFVRGLVGSGPNLFSYLVVHVLPRPF